MDKKILSTSFSLACHTMFLIIAFNLVFAPPSMSEPLSPPVLIHVHLDARPFSPSMGNGEQAPKNLTMTPQMKMTRMKKQPVVKQNLPHQTQVMNAPVPHHKPVVSSDNVVTVVKKNVPALHAPTEPDTHKNLFDAKEVFKNVTMANRKMVSSAVMPVSDISNQIQQTEIKPSMQSEMQDYQGATPYLPFDQNGTGTDIKSFMGYDLYTYEDPSDHVKYFKLSIKVEDIPGSLQSLPKEITFLVDSSNSIGPELLQQFQQGVNKCLERLGSSDKFNVIAFKDTMHKFHEESVPSTSDNINQAEDFLNGFKAGSSTDLYDTVLKAVDSPHSMKPSYLFLISDGEPTQGITDSLQLINKIGAINHGRVPIFGLGAGWANQYFMNFLSFTNHGWAEFVPLNTVSSITQLYDHIKDPVLTDIRYYSVGLDKNEIYPKLLPDLFKGSEFVLYGRYTHENTFLLQMRGNSQADIKQYLIKDSLDNGRQGDRTIAQEWAMRKIYDLIGKLQYDQNNQAIVDEVKGLAAKFNLKVPEYKINP